MSLKLLPLTLTDLAIGSDFGIKCVPTASFVMSRNFASASGQWARD